MLFQLGQRVYCLLHPKSGLTSRTQEDDVVLSRAVGAVSLPTGWSGRPSWSCGVRAASKSTGLSYGWVPTADRKTKHRGKAPRWGVAVRNLDRRVSRSVVYFIRSLSPACSLSWRTCLLVEKGYRGGRQRRCRLETSVGTSSVVWGTNLGFRGLGYKSKFRSFTLFPAGDRYVKMIRTTFELFGAALV